MNFGVCSFAQLYRKGGTLLSPWLIQAH